MTINDILGINSNGFVGAGATNLELTDEELATIRGGSWGAAVSVATATIAAGAALVTGGGYFAVCWAVSAACILAAALGLSSDAPKGFVIMLASMGMTLVSVALVRTSCSDLAQVADAAIALALDAAPATPCARLYCAGDLLKTAAPVLR